MRVVHITTEMALLHETLGDILYVIVFAFNNISFWPIKSRDKLADILLHAKQFVCQARVWLIELPETFVDVHAKWIPTKGAILLCYLKAPFSGEEWWGRIQHRQIYMLNNLFRLLLY